MKVGRPQSIKNKEELISLINKYFDETPVENYTITGLVLAIGINKDTFYEYAQKTEYKDIIDEARLIVENSYELSLRKNGRTGDIFALKNFGWVDKTNQEITGNVGVQKVFITEEDTKETIKHIKDVINES